MPSDEEVLTQELTILATEQPVGFARFIRTMEQLGIHGLSYAYCAYGTVANDPNITNEDVRESKGEQLADYMRYRLDWVGATPLEYNVSLLRTGKPLNEREQTFLARCKDVQKGVQG